MPNQPYKYFPPVLALLAGTVIWGTVWYPYRILREHGLGGTPATFSTYLVTLLFTVTVFSRSWRELSQAPRLFFILTLASGWANYAYVMGTLEGTVMRTLLLFYLAPVWTVPLARWVLNERPTAASYGVVVVALTGAATMLWDPQAGWPISHNLSDWYGLTAGFAFALNNVIARRLSGHSIGAKTFASCLGVLGITAVAMTLTGDWVNVARAGSIVPFSLIVAIGAALFCTMLIVFYGVMHIPAVRAIVIMLFELVVGAVSSHWLVGESMSAREWVGGTLIVAATLFSAFAEPQPR